MKNMLSGALKQGEKYTKIDIRYFASGGFWLSFSQAMQILAGLGVSALFAYLLSETEFGTYRYLIGLGALFSSFALTGLGDSVVQAAAKKIHDYYIDSIRVSFIYSAGILAVSLIGACYYYLNGNITLATGCLIIALLQPTYKAFQNIFAFLQGGKRFKEASLSRSVKAIVVSFSSICAILLTKNILVLFFVYMSSQTIVNLALHAYYRPKKPKITPENEKKRYLRYAQHTSLRNLIADVAFRLDTIIVFQQLGAAELAIYSIANIMPEQIKGFSKSISLLILPKFAKHNNLESLKKIVKKRILFLFGIFSTITALYILAAPYVYSLVFPKYEEAVLYSQLTALAIPALAAVLPLSALRSQLRDRELHIINLQSSIFLIMLTFILIPLYGILGAIVAKIVSRYTNLGLLYYHLYKAKNSL